MCTQVPTVAPVAMLIVALKTLCLLSETTSQLTPILQFGLYQTDDGFEARITSFYGYRLFAEYYRIYLLSANSAKIKQNGFSEAHPSI